MLRHPAAPPITAADRVDVAVGDRGDAAGRPCSRCGDSMYLAPASPPPPPSEASVRVTLPAKELSEAQLAAQLGRYAGVRLLHFEGLRHETGLRIRLAPDRRRAFDESMKPLGGGWCCAEPARKGGVGHYWYDMLFDQHHTDRFGRRWDEGRPWRPVPGP